MSDECDAPEIAWYSEYSEHSEYSEYSEYTPSSITVSLTMPSLGGANSGRGGTTGHAAYSTSAGSSVVPDPPGRSGGAYRKR